MRNRKYAFLFIAALLCCVVLLLLPRNTLDNVPQEPLIIVVNGTRVYAEVDQETIQVSIQS